MFEPLKNILKFFASLKQDEIMFEIIKGDRDIQVTILDLNRMNQLFKKGIDSNNTVIGFYKSTYRGRKLGQLKRQGEPYDFLDTGKFFESFKVIPGNKFFEIVADGQKDGENLFDKYGEDILGLTEESRLQLTQELIPKIQDFIKFKALSL